jgi:hypothetical protein
VTLFDVSLHFLFVSLSYCLAARRLDALRHRLGHQENQRRKRLGVAVGLASTLLAWAAVLAAFTGAVTLYMTWWLPLPHRL